MSKRNCPSADKSQSEESLLVKRSKNMLFSSWTTEIVLYCISEYLSVQDILSASLVNHDFHSVMNSDIVWKNIFSKCYSNRLINEKDPIVGGKVWDDVKSKFPTSLFKAHFAMKKSFAKMTILSHSNVYKQYEKLFVGEVDECAYCDGNENFEPTLEMKQLAWSWFYGGSDSANDCENKYAYFFKEECASYEELLLSHLKNELTNQVIKLVEVPCSNSFGSVHLENDEMAFGSSSEGGYFVSDDFPNNDGVYADIDLMAWIARISCSLYGYPEHGLSYLRNFIKLPSMLGERDEENLLCNKFIKKDKIVKDQKITITFL